MALTYGFYNSVDGDRAYDAIQFGQIFDGIITDGVYATFLKAMVVKASDNPSEVIVQPGRCWFNHTWTYIDADYPVTAPAPEVILDRVDALVIDINTENAFRENSLVWVQGTPSSLNPERPTLIKSVTHNQYPLCYVYRKAGTTMIYAADITNAVGTSETPFVTGVLTGINIDDLLSQWDDEFHTWEASTKTSFEAWMVNQQSVYITWFDSIKDQMEDDLAGFEAWFETIRGIIDEEAATHLQAEIDDILDMLPAGSHIDISTNEPTLFNRNVTVSDGVHSKTVQFNAIGGATVESFPYIGIIDVSSTDGERIASETLNIPYFGRYSATLAFWSATVNLVGDETLAGLAVTVRDGNGDVVAIVTLNASGQGVFTATGPDTYKFIYTYGGQTMEVSLAVTQETTYEVEIHGGFNYQAWLDAGRVSETFESLDDILEDEPTLRQLFLVHDAVDYLASQNVNTDVTKIFNTDLAAKWINLSDYALDHFYAVADIKTVMDTADKYGYGEWVITDDSTTPPTWGPKGNVPVMTGNSAPYGEAFASSYLNSTYVPYKAFDGTVTDVTDAWLSAENQAVNSYLGYAFVNPICVTKIKFTNRYGNNDGIPSSFKLQGSNDGSTWTDIQTITHSSQTSGESTVYSINNTEYYLKYRIYILGIQRGNYASVGALQFYGRELKVSVPTMTSNTAPFGEAIGSGAESTSYDKWKAFDGNDSSTSWASDNSGIEGRWLGFGFGRPVALRLVKTIFYGMGNNVYRTPKKYKIQGSNDGMSWADLADCETNITGAVSPMSAIFDEVSTNSGYRYFRLYASEKYPSGTSVQMQIFTLQFYGLDYSEKEFEVGTTKKWLYDHGLVLGDQQIASSGYSMSGYTMSYAINGSDELILDGPGTGSVIKYFAFTNSEDLSNYDYIFVKRNKTAGDKFRVYVQTTKTAEPTASYSDVSSGDKGLAALSISSFNQTGYPIYALYNAASSVYAEVKELWLE